MEENKPTQEIKRQAVTVNIHAKHNDFDISQFLNVARSFVHKVPRELETSDGDVERFAKRRTRKPRPDAVKAQTIMQQVQDIIDEEPSKSIRAISRDLQVYECTIRRIVHEDIRYKSYVMRRGQFMSAQTREQRFIRAKRLLNKVKHPEIPDMLWFYSDEKYF